jgi:probable HAF family extracellular repeat protein
MKTIAVIFTGLMACLAIGVSTAQGQTDRKYSLEDLGVVKGMEASQPAAMNNLTHIAGTAYKGEQTCAFHYDYSKKYMEDAGGLNSRGFGISSTNVVVGDAFFISTVLGSHAAILQGGFAKDLGVLKGQTFSRANGINAIGQVVGFSGRKRDSSDSRAFMWTGQAGMMDIGTLGGAYAQAYAINDAGYITGTAQTAAADVMPTHAFVYRALSPNREPMRDLGVLGGNYSYGMAINSYNHVVGYSTVRVNANRVHGFLHDGRNMIDLGSLSPGSTSGSDVSVALGVNKLDQVVGYSYLPAAGEAPMQQVAFLWSRISSTVGGKMVNLNTLLDDTGQNYLLVSAVAINDNGQILASAYITNDGGSLRAVLLTPLK